MTAQHPELPPDDRHEVIHLGGEAAVIVPLAEYQQLRERERLTALRDAEDAEDAAALADSRAREAAGRLRWIPHDEVRRRLGLT